MKTDQPQALRITAKVASLAAAMLLATAAQADLLTLNSTPNVSTDINITGLGSETGVGAGIVSLNNTNTNNTFWAYCIEPLQGLSAALLGSGETYDHQAFTSSSTSLPAGASFNPLINVLFDQHYNEAAGDDESAAFQLALWILAYNTPSTPYSAMAYNLVDYANLSGNSSDVVLTAQNWLDGLATGSASTHYTLTLWTASGSQDFLSAVPDTVPEPSVLVLLGLAGLAAARSRRWV